MSSRSTAETSWYEPGARNARFEFKHWLHIESDKPSYWLAPWPFAVHRRKPYGLDIDPGLLIAHYNISKFQNWPGEWFALRLHLIKAALAHERYLPPPINFWWGLFRSPTRSQLLHSPENAMPEEIINALIGPRKASR